MLSRTTPVMVENLVGKTWKHTTHTKHPPILPRIYAQQITTHGRFSMSEHVHRFYWMLQLFCFCESLLHVTLLTLKKDRKDMKTALAEMELERDQRVFLWIDAFGRLKIKPGWDYTCSVEFCDISANGLSSSEKQYSRCQYHHFLRNHMQLPHQ